MPMCPFCRIENGPFVESHVVPKAIMVDAMTPGLPSIKASTDPSLFPKRSRTGIYSKIVCGDCEKSFQGGDDYLISVYRGLSSCDVVAGGDISVLKDVDPLLLKKAILAVAYRAHLSDDPIYKPFDLGVYAEPLRAFLRSADLDSPSEFSVVLRHMVGRFALAVFGSEPTELAGATSVFLHIPRLTAIIRFDSRPFRGGLEQIELKRGEAVSALRFDDLIPSEKEALAEMVKAQGESIAKVLKKLGVGKSGNGSGGRNKGG